MTHVPESNPLEQMIQVLDEYGFDGMARAIGILVNEAMKIERSEVLGAQPYERSEERRGYANGFKPKTLQTRVGAVELKVPQTRGVEFYPKSLERGVRSERAWQPSPVLGEVGETGRDAPCGEVASEKSSPGWQRVEVTVLRTKAPRRHRPCFSDER